MMMTSLNPLNGDLPKFARSLLQVSAVTAIIGIATFLVWVGATKVNQANDAIIKTLAEHMETTKTQVRQQAALTVLLSAIMDIQQKDCTNNANTSFQRSSCDEIARTARDRVIQIMSGSNDKGEPR